MPVAWEDFEAVDQPKTEAVDWNEFEPAPQEVPDVLKGVPRNTLELAAKNFAARQQAKYLPPEGLGRGEVGALEPFVSIPRVESTDPRFKKAVKMVMDPFGDTEPSQSDLEGIAAVLNTGKGVLETAQSPLGIATAGVGALGGIAAKLASLGWGLFGASQIPKSVEAYKQAKSGQEKLEAGLGVGLNLALPVGAATHIYPPFVKPALPEVLARQIGKAHLEVPPGLQRPVEPLREVVTAAAYKNPETGEVTAGSFHKEAAEVQDVKAPDEKSARETKDFGFIVEDPKTGATEFKTRPETQPIAEASGQLIQEPERPNQPHSDDIAAPGTDTPIADTKIPEAVKEDPLQVKAPPTAPTGEAQPEVPSAGKAEGGVSAPPAPAIPEGGISPAEVQVGEPAAPKVEARLERFAPATGKWNKFVKMDGEWFKVVGGKPQKTPIPKDIGLGKALEEQLAKEQSAPPPSPPTLTPAESTRLKSLTEKMESGKPLTSAEQKRYRALKDKVSPPEGDKPSVEAGVAATPPTFENLISRVSDKDDFNQAKAVIENSKNLSIPQKQEWIDELNKSKSQFAPPTTPPSTGEGMAGPATTELYAGVPVGLDKFIESDLKPLLKKGVDATKALSDVVVNWFSPASHTKGRDVDVLFESKGYAEQFKTKAAAAVEQANKMVGSLPEKEQIDFIDRVKRGEKQATPELQTIADLLRKWDDRLYQEAKVYKPSLNYLDNHLRVLWKVIPGSPEAIGLSKTSIGSKRPWRGSQGFTRRHVLEDMSEGLDLGGVPVTYNPVEMFLLHAQDVMKFVSANRAWEALKKTGSVEFVREGKKPPEGFRRFDDPIAKPYFRTEEGLKAKPGEWWVDEGTARMLHNYLSRDYIRTGKFGPVGRGLLALKNATTAIELGLSPFHAVFESNETMASSLGLGIAKMASGKAREGINDIVSAGASPVTTAKLGGAAIRYAKDEASFSKNYPDAYKWFTDRYPEARQMIKDLFTGGGQVSMHEDYRIRARKGFEKAVAEGNYPGAMLRAIPALSELANKPLFETYIPRLKVGMFLREYAFELERNSGDLASGKITREALARKTWGFIEDRFGELNWDNLYWDRTFKTAMQLMFRSVTWKLGNIRGFGKAGRDIASEVGTKGTGDPIQMVVNQLNPPKGAAPKVTLPMAWVAGS